MRRRRKNRVAEGGGGFPRSDLVAVTGEPVSGMMVMTSSSAHAVRLALDSRVRRTAQMLERAVKEMTGRAGSEKDQFQGMGLGALGLVPMIISMRFGWPSRSGSALSAARPKMIWVLLKLSLIHDWQGSGTVMGHALEEASLRGPSKRRRRWLPGGT